MRVLILGGCGFMGSHLVDGLLSRGHEITVFDRERERYRPPAAGVEYVIGDLRDDTKLRRSFACRPEIVVHMISTTVPTTSNGDPIRDIDDNLKGAVRILQKCVEDGVKRIVFPSSGGAVYGTLEDGPAMESSEPYPISSYGIVKLAVEKYMHLFKSLHGTAYTALRIANSYGPRQNPEGRQGVIGIFCRKIMNNETVEIWGDGSSVKDYIYVDDVVDAFILAIEKAVDGVFNIGSGIGTSLNEIIREIEVATGIACRRVNLGQKEADVQNIVLNVSKARRELGWKPCIDLKTGIGWTLDWMRELRALKV